MSGGQNGKGTVLDVEEIAELFIDDGDDDVNHMWCCDPDVAWCGADISGDPASGYDFSVDPEDCAMCLLADEQGQYVCKVCNPRG